MNPMSIPSIAGRGCGRPPRNQIPVGASAAGIVLVLLAGAAQVSAQLVIPAGNDYWKTVQPTDISFGLDEIPLLPGALFGPGCDPFVGTVPLCGEPLDPLNWHTTDTVVRRAPINFGPPMSPPVNVPIELVQMSLVSCAPISVNCPGGVTQWNIEVRESPTIFSPGNMQVTLDTPNSGRILQSTISVSVDVALVPVGGGPSTILPPLPPIQIQSVGLYQWKTTPWTFAYPGSGPNFYPGNGPYTLLNPGDVTHTICPPPPPWDHFETWVPDNLSQDDTWVDLGTTPGGYPSIPSGFFDPGSEPFTGQIKLRGQPLDIGNLGNTDTVVQRTADPFQQTDPPGTTGTVPIEIVALSLVSVEPIIITYPPSSMRPPELWNVTVGLSSVTPPAGSLTATKTHPNGGTFSATLPVQPLLTFTRHPDGAVRVIDSGLFGLPALQFSWPNGNFVHLLDPSISTMFYHHPLARWTPGVIETIPGDTTSQQPESPILPAPEGPASHRICIPKRQPKVCIYSVSCADGSCDLCPFCTGDVCQSFRCPGLTCPGSFSSTCGPNCCLEFALITCGPPAGEPFCPLKQPCICDPTPGACCDATTGACTVVPECECTGTYLGDGTTCGPVGACCLPGGSCVEMDAQCCHLAGGVFEGGTCDPPLGCCLPNGTCQDMDPECCVLAGGMVKATLCAPPVACCLPGAGGCVMLDPDCCVLLGGQLDPSGVCEPVKECCLPGGLCVDMDPDCCVLAGGQPGANLCGPPQRCCINGTCIDTDPDCCVFAGGIPGPGVCAPPVECCTGIVCIDQDPVCCQIVFNGTPGIGPCEPPQECCLGTGACVETDPDCCAQAGGTSSPDNCDPPQVCCVNPVQGGACVANIEPDCCITDLNGLPDGPGNCVPEQACCLPDGSCVELDPFCCQRWGGTPQGAGSICSAPQACCINGTCMMLDPLCCQGFGGTSQGPGSQCGPIVTGCCKPDGSCQNLDPICCDDEGGTAIPTACAGVDINPPNGRDDACDGGGGPNPPTTCPAPHDRRKNRYICFTPDQSTLTVQVAYRVDKLTAPTGICWVGAPDANNRSQCVDSPVFRMWTEPYLEVGDCEIIPVADFQVRGTLDGLNMGGPFNVGTILQPSPKLWGDTAGNFNGIEWTPPNQIGNVNDILAILARISVSVGAPIFEVANLQAISSADSCLNPLVNTADVLICVRAVSGDSYGPPATAKIVDPNNCPSCP